MYAFLLKPPLKDYIWGGTKLISDFNKKTDKEIIAESWELSCHKDGQSIIMNGEFKGRTLADVISEVGKEKILGTACDRFNDFPILIKLIDAKNDLSIQVHPDNNYALLHEGEYGKTEMWYIVDCEPDAFIYYGFKEQISKNEFKRRIQDNDLLPVLKKQPVKPGDVYFIEAGTLHAICSGILIAEIQQNSNTTYRIYDYDRIGADGKKRELHIDKAVDVTNTGPAAEAGQGSKAVDGPDFCCELLSKCEYFTAVKYSVRTRFNNKADGKSFHSLLCLDGDAVIKYAGRQIELKKGDSVFIPAALGKYEICGRCELILTYIE